MQDEYELPAHLVRKYAREAVLHETAATLQAALDEVEQGGSGYDAVQPARQFLEAYYEMYPDLRPAPSDEGGE